MVKTIMRLWDHVNMFPGDFFSHLIVRLKIEHTNHANGRFDLVFPETLVETTFFITSMRELDKTKKYFFKKIELQDALLRVTFSVLNYSLMSTRLHGPNILFFIWRIWLTNLINWINIAPLMKKYFHQRPRELLRDSFSRCL